MTNHMTPRTATLIGLTAILMWSLLAVLTVATGKIPAFQLAAMTFAIGALVAFAELDRGGPQRFARCGSRRWPGSVGVGGLFGYHALYFLALRFAPPAEAGLLNYLWPLLIVLFSSLLPGERLAPHHIIGAAARARRHGAAVRRQHRRGFAPGQLPGLDRGLRRGLRLGGLFGDVAPAQGGADRRGGGLLPGDRAARRARASAWSRPRSGRRRRRNGWRSSRSASARSAPRSMPGTSA